MKTLTLWLLLSSLIAYGQSQETLTLSSPPPLHWARSYDGSELLDKANAISVDRNGYVYITGRSDTTSTMGDCITIKYGPQGDTIWTRRWSRPTFNGLDEGLALALDDNLNVYITGRTQTTASEFDVLTIKYDSQGELQWARISPYGVQNGRDDAGYNLALDPLGNIFVVGRSNRRAYVFKYDTNGTLVDYGTNFSENPNGFNLITIKGDFPSLIMVGGGLGGYIRQIDPNNVDSEIKVYRVTPDFDVFDYNPIVFQLDGLNDLYILAEAKKNPNSTPACILQKNRNGETYPFRSSMRSISSGVYAHGLAIDQALNIYTLMSYNSGGTRLAYTRKIKSNILYEVGPDEWELDTLWTRTYTFDPGLSTVPINLVLNQSDSLSGLYITGNTVSGDIFSLEYATDGTFLWDTIYDCGNLDVGAKMTHDRFGNLYITGRSNCDNGTEDCLTLKYCVSIPDKPSNISGLNSVCLGSSHTFSVLNDTEVNYYKWEYPPGWHAANDSSNAITITFDTSAQSGLLRVSAFSEVCPSEIQEIYINVYSQPIVPESINGKTTVCSGALESYSLNLDPNIAEYSWYAPQDWQGASISNSIEYLVGNAGGEIQVIASNVCGSDTSYLPVEVIFSPTPPSILNGPTSICSGDTVLYFTQGSSDVVDFLWDLPNGWTILGDTFNDTMRAVAVENEIGIHTRLIAVSARNSCGLSEPIESDVEVMRIDNSINKIDEHSASSNELDAEYQWLMCLTNEEYTDIPGATAQTYTAQKDGDYAVRIAKNNCDDISGCIHLQGPSRTNSELNGYSVSVAPNPTEDLLIVSLSNGIIRKVTLFDHLGRAALETTTNDVQFFTLNVGGLGPGVYLITIRTSNGVRTQKVVVI